MRRNTLNKLLILCCALAVLGCKAKKQVVAAKSAGSSANNHAVVSPIISSKLTEIRKRQADFTTFSGRAKTKLDINGNSNDVTLNIRIQKGQKIWVSITAIAGIEVARALITPDSLLVLNKLQGMYLRKPFSYIYRYTSHEVDYSSIEALLVGNAIPQLLNDGTQMQSDSGKTILSGNLQELVYKLVLGPDMKASHTDLDDQGQGQSLTVDNSAFIPSGNRILPSQINMTSVAKTKKVQVNLHYIKADFDLPLEYPFSIPSRYAPAN
ncbi:MAG TPA: DUF4292 domain-containing protein [Mucilaginibacter sp.]